MKLRSIVSAALVATAAIGGSAQASLSTFQSFVGSYGVSTDGWGSDTQTGVITANVPFGATVVGAYLYTSTFGTTTLAGVGGTIDGNVLGAVTNLGSNGGSLTAGRYDVTSFLKPVIDGGIGGAYNFSVTETSDLQDGYALVVVYQDLTLATSTVGILDGFAAQTGDTTTLNFATGINTAAPGFGAEMRLGIGFSYDNTPCGAPASQTSTVAVNGTTITNVAGCNDDSADLISTNGNLITMGGDNDAFSPNLPNVEDDHERYNLVPQITNGDTSITVTNQNASQDDNIFLAVFKVSGEASINNPIPEPASLALVGLALAGLGWQRRTAAKRA